MAEWVAVCRLDELKEGAGRSLDAPGLRLAIFRTGAEVVALSGRCPHSGGSLGHGWIEEGEVGLPAPPLALPAVRRPLHDHPGRTRPSVPLRGEGG